MVKKEIAPIEYSIELVPKTPFRKRTNQKEIDEITKLEIIRKKRSLVISSKYKNEEFYNVKISFPNFLYSKSYNFKEGKDSILKKDIKVKDKDELKRIKVWVYDRLSDIIYSEYRKSGGSKDSLVMVKKDLEQILSLLI